ncbi:MAG: 50S ribosomal protein L5 [Conexivisphaerales archaeon]|jgi:large subunit ribosomal protein L5
MSADASAQEIKPAATVSLGKIVLNIAPGKSGEMVERASKVLETLTEQKPSQRKAKKTVRDFGIHLGEPIAVVVTVRKDKATDVLRNLLQAKSNVVNESSFDDLGNMAFGIKEHIDIPGVRYDPTVGIFGMDVCVSLEKQGLRVGRRRRAQARPGRRQRVTKKEAISFFKTTFGVEIR